MTAKLETRFLIVSLVLVAINLLGFNHLLELMAEEPRRSIIAIEMLKSGDFAIPHIYGEIYYNKPPLYNWLIAGSMALFGTGEWAARLPGILSLMATGGLLFFLCKQYFKKSTAILVALAYITSIELLFYGSTNTAEIDIFYGLITAVQVLAIFKFRQSEEYIKLFLWSYFFAAIGVMTKGIPTVAFQGLTLFGYLIATKRFKQLFSLSHLLGIGLFTIIVGGYLYYFSLHEDLLKFLSQQFQEASQRSANEAKDVNILTNMAIFIAMLLQKLLPWSLLAFFFIFKSVRGVAVQNKLLHFSLVFLASNILIYWTGADVRTRYLYPFFPFIIIILVSLIEKIEFGEKYTSRFYLFFNSLIFTLPIGIIALPFILGISNSINLTISLMCSISIIIIGYKNIRQRDINYGMWAMILCLLIGRTFFSTSIMPELNALTARAHYRSTVATMIEKSEGKPVVLAGPHERYYPNVTLLGNVFYSDTIKYPGEVTFKIPYYYAHQTGNIMQFTSDPNSKEVNYLMYEFILDRYPVKKKILYKFYNQYNKLDLVLFAIED